MKKTGFLDIWAASITNPKFTKIDLENLNRWIPEYRPGKDFRNIRTGSNMAILEELAIVLAEAI
jgi:hypothetical protein